LVIWVLRLTTNFYEKFRRTSLIDLLPRQVKSQSTSAIGLGEGKEEDLLQPPGLDSRIAQLAVEPEFVSIVALIRSADCNVSNLCSQTTLLGRLVSHQRSRREGERSVEIEIVSSVVITTWRKCPAWPAARSHTLTIK
jgi:hypothetical protein